LTDFQKKKIIKYQIFMEIRPVGAEFFHADWQTDWQAWQSWVSLSAILWTQQKSYFLLTQRC